jgi:PAS domain S-box-containing protein
MFVLDCETGRVLAVNDAAIEKYGFSRDTFFAFGMDKVVPEEYRPEMLAILAQGLEGPARDEEAEHSLADGRRIPVLITSFPLAWNGRPARFSMARDSRMVFAAGASPRPAASLPSDQAARSEPALPGAATHDFNNLLTVILAIAERMQGGHGDPGEQAELIARTVRNAQELAHQRLLIGYQQQSRREQLNLNEVLREQSQVLAAVLGEQIRLEMDFDHALWPVFADAQQWNEAVLNLAMNARDAMPSGGLFHISTRRALLPAGDLELGLPHGRYVHLVVRDTGTGMAPETCLHAFEPYFSTKSRVRNSGLGLASVDGVVRQSGGRIRLTSAPGEGARFDIFIPVPENLWAAAEGGLVLLVEDAGELRKLIQEFLTGRGYEVISCGSAEAAMQSARSVGRPIDLVISDMFLPDVPGEILVEQVKLQHPEARVILMSGQQPALVHGPAAGDAVYLQKPFGLHQLAAAAAQLLKPAPRTPKADALPAAPNSE